MLPLIDFASSIAKSIAKPINVVKKKHNQLAKTSVNKVSFKQTREV